MLEYWPQYIGSHDEHDDASWDQECNGTKQMESPATGPCAFPQHKRQIGSYDEHDDASWDQECNGTKQMESPATGPHAFPPLKRQMVL